jgi:hypothetical protein
MDRSQGRVILELHTLPVKENVRVSVEQMCRSILVCISTKEPSVTISITYSLHKDKYVRHRGTAPSYFFF